MANDMGKKNVIFTTATLEGGVWGVWGGKESRRRAGSPSSPAGPFIMPLGASAAVVKKTGLRIEKALAEFGRTEHSAIHIQSELSTPFTRPSLTAL
jgi:hypothetical protein